MKSEYTIIVADDHTLFREGIVRILKQFNGFTVIDIAVNGADAVEKILRCTPDIAILDISMPLLSGIDVLSTLKEKECKTLCIILTMYTEESYLEAAMLNGVKGYLLKDSTIDEIEECLRAIISGRYFVSAKLTNFLVSKMPYKQNPSSMEQRLEKLTPSEIQVLKLLAQKKTSTQIADELYISYRTVQKHRQNCSIKLGLQGYNQLLFFATENEKILNTL